VFFPERARIRAWQASVSQLILIGERMTERAPMR